jgi:hypothetical protein
MKLKTAVSLTLCLAASSVRLAYADEAIKTCEPGQNKAMVTYESADQNVISFGNIFVCTAVSLHTEAGMRELRSGLRTIHKNAVLISVLPLAS